MSSGESSLIDLVLQYMAAACLSLALGQSISNSLLSALSFRQNGKERVKNKRKEEPGA